MNRSVELKQNAENCAELASKTADERARRRFERMQRAWIDLADTQAWLDAEKGATRAPT